ncbi:hypothetical protein BaRGS_00035051, partial [Batillaria attramentaria]
RKKNQGASAGRKAARGGVKSNVPRVCVTGWKPVYCHWQFDRGCTLCYVDVCDSAA